MPHNTELISLGALPAWVKLVGVQTEEQDEVEKPCAFAKGFASAVTRDSSTVRWGAMAWITFSVFRRGGWEWGPNENSKPSRMVHSFLLWLSRKWSERWERESALSRNEIGSGLYPKPTCRCWNSSSNTKSNKLMNSEAKLFHLSESVCQIWKPNRACVERWRMDPPCRHGERYWEA